MPDGRSSTRNSAPATPPSPKPVTSPPTGRLKHRQRHPTGKTPKFTQFFRYGNGNFLPYGPAKSCAPVKARLSLVRSHRPPRPRSGRAGNGLLRDGAGSPRSNRDSESTDPSRLSDAADGDPPELLAANFGRNLSGRHRPLLQRSVRDDPRDSERDAVADPDSRRNAAHAKPRFHPFRQSDPSPGLEPGLSALSPGKIHEPFSGLRIKTQVG